MFELENAIQSLLNKGEIKQEDIDNARQRAKEKSKLIKIEQRLMEVEQGVGAGGETPKKGLAQRLDDLEVRIVALESK